MICLRKPFFAGHLWEKFSSDVMDSAYEELRSQKLQPKAEQALSLFTSRVRDIVKRPLEVVSASDTIQTAASLMTEKGVGSILVPGAPPDDIVGIITPTTTFELRLSPGESARNALFRTQ